MKRIWMLVLLISVGLNIGFGIRQLNGRDASHNEFRREYRARNWPAQGDSSVWRGRLERRLSHLADRLGLDERQREAFRRHNETAGRELASARGRVETGRRRLHDELGNRPLDPAGVRRAAADLSRSQAAMDSLVAEKLLSEMEILTPEQHDNYLRMLPMERFGFGHGPGPGGRRGCAAVAADREPE